MFELMFGIMWLLITGIVTYMFYGTGGSVHVNGELVSHEEFCEMLMPKLFLGLFFAIGIYMLSQGVVKIFRNIRTNTIGKELIGIVLYVEPNGNSTNGRPQLDATVLVSMKNGKVHRYAETIGYDWNEYMPGDFVMVKHYKNDINIIEKIQENRVAYDACDLLKAEYSKQTGEPINTKHYNTFEQQISSPDTIVINGVEYTRKT